jgi:hypothetical protein
MENKGADETRESLRRLEKEAAGDEAAWLEKVSITISH